MKPEFSRHIFEKYSNIKFHENPSSVSSVVPWGRKDGRTGMTKPIVDFRSFANAPKNNHLMLFLEINALCSEIHTKHK
jgi:hypothetical protein